MCGSAKNTKHARVELFCGEDLVNLVPHLRPLVARPRSGMDHMLDEIVAVPEFREKVTVAVAAIGSVDVGFAALCAPGSWDYGLMVHVLEPHRRKKIGTALIRRLLERAEAPPAVFHGTERAGAFWSTFGRRVRSL